MVFNICIVLFQVFVYYIYEYELCRFYVMTEKRGCQLQTASATPLQQKVSVTVPILGVTHQPPDLDLNPLPMSILVSGTVPIFGVTYQPPDLDLKFLTL